jgi:Fe-S-cluster containining protein
MAASSVERRSFAPGRCAYYIGARQVGLLLRNMKPPRRALSAADETALLQQVEAVYEELENRPIERSCVARTDCCRFRLTGKIPYVTRGEALLAARAWRASGRRTLEETAEADGRCPFLDPNSQRCLIYSARPFACRSHFCAAAGGPYRRSEVLDLIRRLEDIDSQSGRSFGPRPLIPAVAEALRKR